MTNFRSLYYPLLVVFCLGIFGCTPKYPKCNNDKDCHSQGHPKEFCVNGMCQECRRNDDCANGFECNHGRCQAIQNYCNDASQCPPDQGCVNNRCQPCTADEDCGPGGKCNQGRCRKPGSLTCTTDDDC